MEWPLSFKLLGILNLVLVVALVIVYTHQRTRRRKVDAPTSSVSQVSGNPSERRGLYQKINGEYVRIAPPGGVEEKL